MSKTIDYYHFLISPWSYLAIKQFNQVRENHDLIVNYKPIDVMQTFDNMGGLPPGKRHPSRQRFRMDELKRWAAHLNVPMNLTPAHFPTNQALAAQMVFAADGATTLDLIMTATPPSGGGTMRWVTSGNGCSEAGRSIKC